MITYKILVVQHSDTRYSARPLAWPAVYTEAESETAVLEKLRARLILLHAQGQIVDMEIPILEKLVDNPWLQHAGIWEHDPNWEVYQEAIAAYRREIDAETMLEEIHAGDSDNPWLRFAGSSKDDPTWEFRQQVIEEYRRELDAEMATVMVEEQ